MPNAIMHFEIPADDVERAKGFYTKLFGWKFESYPTGPGEDEYFMVMAKDGEDGINGGLMKRKMPGQPFCVFTYPSDQLNTFVTRFRAYTRIPAHPVFPRCSPCDHVYDVCACVFPA